MDIQFKLFEEFVISLKTPREQATAWIALAHGVVLHSDEQLTQEQVSKINSMAKVSMEVLRKTNSLKHEWGTE